MDKKKQNKKIKKIKQNERSKTEKKIALPTNPIFLNNFSRV